MGILNRLLGRKEEIVNRVAGRTDLLEAVCAGAALVAGADGDISDAEIQAAIKVVKNNDTLSKAFTQVQIDNTMSAQIDRANGGFSGRRKLWQEIEEVAKDAKDAEIVALMVLDVAWADNSVSPEEQGVIDKVGTTLKIDMKKLAA